MSSLESKIHAANTTLLVEGQVDRIPDFFTPGYVVHLTDQVLVGGHALAQRFLGMLRRAFPTIDVEVEILVEGADRIAWQRTLRATNEGSFAGFPATHRRLVWRDMLTSRFEDGRIAEEWVITDLAERLLLARRP
jgi:predicted ester cyclase